MTLEKKDHNFKTVVATFIASIKFLNTLDKGLVRNYVILGLMTGTRPFVNIYLLKAVINALSQNQPFSAVFTLACIAVSLNLILSLIENFLGHHSAFRMEVLTEKRNMEVGRKNAAMDYEYIEDADLHIEMNKMYNMDYNGGFGLWAQLVHCMDLAKNTVLFAAGLVLSIPMYRAYAPILNIPLYLQNIIFSALILLIAFAVIKINKQMQYSRDKFLKSDVFKNRLPFSYAIQNLFNYKSGKDVRLYNTELYDSYFQKQMEFDKKVDKKYLALRLPPKLAVTLFTTISLLLVYVFVGIKAYYGAIQIGDIVQYSGAVTQFVFALSGLAAVYGEIVNNCDFFDLCLGYINLKETKYMGTLPVEKRNDNKYEFEFKNVGFKYPGTDKFVLKNINLKITIGERLAIVGMNGSGKTTFIKLLTRLYDPDEGEILLNGVNIKKFNYDEYLDLFSVVFQDFSLFAFTLGQNVAAALDYDGKKVTDALTVVGFADRLQTMPHGTDSYLYKDFHQDGVEISGGEAQKIAMARAIYKDAPFIILDEPTAALDPISESEIYSGFDKIVGDKTAVYISHRLSSCKFCSKIAVFDNGSIVQFGSHQELVSDTSGKYYELWNAQAHYYKE